MGRLLYSVIGSLDGYINDEAGDFGWAEPGVDLIAFYNAQMEGVSTYLYGRRMYETMQVWETDPHAARQSPESAVFAELWKRAEKLVFSHTLDSVPTQRTRLLHSFDPEEIRRVKADATGDLTIDGPGLAVHALRSGLVDEIHRVVVPVIVGGGTPLFPPELRLQLDLVEERRFDRGLIHLRYAVR